MNNSLNNIMAGWRDGPDSDGEVFFFVPPPSLIYPISRTTLVPASRYVLDFVG